MVDSLKLLQLAMNTPIGPLYQASYDIKNDKHVVMTITMRDTARHLDWPALELNIAMAQGDWAQRLKTSLVNPAPPVATLPPPTDCGYWASWRDCCLWWTSESCVKPESSQGAEGHGLGHAAGATAGADPSLPVGSMLRRLQPLHAVGVLTHDLQWPQMTSTHKRLMQCALNVTDASRRPNLQWRIGRAKRRLGAARLRP